jgi:hypothetical protein
VRYWAGDNREGRPTYSRYLSLCSPHLRIIAAVRLKAEDNQLVDVFGEIGFHIDVLKGS